MNGLQESLGALLEGFAGARRCDDAGRTAMLRELDAYAAELSRLTALRPLVRVFVKNVVFFFFFF